jgi:O-antigen biosynthesis protein
MIYSANLTASLRLGNALCKLTRYEEATIAYRQAIQFAPEQAEAYVKLADILLLLDRSEEAISIYQKARAIEPNFPEIDQKLASALQAKNPSQTQILGEGSNGKTVEKQRCKEDSISFPDISLTRQEEKYDTRKTYPQNLNYYLDLAKKSIAEGSMEKAIVICQIALRIDTESADAYHGLAEALSQLRQYPEAADCWYRCLQLQPNRADASDYCQLGKSLFAQGKYPAAEDCFRRSLQLQSDLYDAQYLLGQSLSLQQQWQEAIDNYQQSVKIEPHRWEARHLMAEAWQEVGRLEEAVMEFQRAIQCQPEVSWCHNGLGNVLFKLNRPEAAKQAYLRSIELNPDFAWAHYNLGEIAAAACDWDEAIQAYRTALKIQPDLPHAAEKLSYLLHQRGENDLQDALNFYRQAIAQQSNKLEIYPRAIELAPKDIKIHTAYGKALLDGNQIDKAIEQFQTVLEFDPEAASATILLQKAFDRRTRLQAGYGISSTSTSYALWLRQNLPTPAKLEEMRANISTLGYLPPISILIPTYNTPPAYLKEAIESVIAQIYPHWELCIADDASSLPHIRSILEEYSQKDSRIKYTIRAENGHISAASNSALALATGEYISLLDHDDLLAPNALYAIVCLLNEHPEADYIYSDEDKIDENGQLREPFFKPDWCPDSYLSRNYTCHFSTYRRKIVETIGGFRLGYEGSQDYDLTLRFTEKTDKIFHISQILYHWRIHSNSAAASTDVKPYAYQAAIAAIGDAISRRGEGGKVNPHSRFPGYYQVRYQIKHYDLVTIVIPTRNLGKVLDRCLESIFTLSTYPNYEVLLIDNGSDEPESLEIIHSWQQKEPKRFRTIVLDIPFNYSYLNNYAASQTEAKYLLFLNNDTEVLTADWIEAMVEQAQRRSIGAIGAKLLYPDNTIQHAGVIMGLGGIAGHGHKNFPADHPNHFGQIDTVNNYTAVTAACLMCRRDLFLEVGGFNEDLKVAFNDVDLCLKIQRQGYNNIYLPHVVLYHYESKSRGFDNYPEKQARFDAEIQLMLQLWAKEIAYDRCYNPHLTLHREDYGLAVTIQIEVLKVTSAKANPDVFWGFCLDYPIAGEVVNEVSIAGWAIGKNSTAVAIEVIHDMDSIQTIAIDRYRPDVAKAFPHLDNIAVCGFSAELNVLDLPEKSESILTVIFDDNTSAVLGTIELHCRFNS